MKKTITLGLSLLFFSQTIKSQSDYVLTKSKDTIKVKIISWNDQDFVPKVKCDINGVIKKFKAKDLIEFRVDESYYEVGRVNATLIGFKKNMFLKRYTKGKINLYGITVVDNFRSSAKVGERQGYNTTTEIYQITHNTVGAKVIFVKKDDGNKPRFKKLFGYSKLRAMTADCDAYTKKFGQNIESMEYPYVEQILFYNNNCN